MMIAYTVLCKELIVFIIGERILNFNNYKFSNIFNKIYKTNNFLLGLITLWLYWCNLVSIKDCGFPKQKSLGPGSNPGYGPLFFQKIYNKQILSDIT